MNREKQAKGEKIGDALLKVALGCKIEEVTEEYAEVDGEMKLTKRRKTKKDIPPDLKAVQMLLSERGPADYAALSDGELEAERQRLLALLAEDEPSKREAAREETFDPRAAKEEKPESKAAEKRKAAGRSKREKKTIAEGGAAKIKRRPATRRRVVRKAETEK